MPSPSAWFFSGCLAKVFFDSLVLLVPSSLPAGISEDGGARLSMVVDKVASPDSQSSHVQLSVETSKQTILTCVRNRGPMAVSASSSLGKRDFRHT